MGNRRVGHGAGVVFVSGSAYCSVRTESTQYFFFSIHCVAFPIIGKAVPLQAWSGPEGSRKLRFPDFMTTA